MPAFRPPTPPAGAAPGPGTPLDATTRPVPAGSRLRLLPTTERPSPGALTGGSPWRMLRLTPRGDRLVDAWDAGVPVGNRAGARRLAGRLVDGGLATLLPEPTPPRDAADLVDVVVPVRDDPEGLEATLAALGADVRVVVVDDGSAERLVAAGPVAGPVEVVRHARPGGPAAARNTGWRRADREIVAFVDAGCCPPPGWLAALVGHFSDPAVAAVAPRIVTPVAARRTVRGAYEHARGALDLGAVGGPVRPRSPIPYVPTAALLVRRSALEAVGGLDETLRTGEDVDLVWRLEAAGWRVRYDPSVRVGHPVRPSWRTWLAQRFAYGRSAAALSARHPGQLAPAVVTPPAAIAGAAVAAGHPWLGLAVAGAAAARDLRGRDGPLPPSTVARLAAAWHLAAGRGLARALRREWGPALLAAALVSRRARRLAVAAALPVLAEWWRERPGVDLPRWVGVALADDLAYGAGVWAGAVRARSGACLLPAWRGRARRRTRPHNPRAD
ncbi:MAG TPA: mycofactocin biosynthesis glycosyltransferase MftF [Acidimicrobiales bacterium]|nr:mycofactocin biosynthesis glycosyltransferase MftF [Acidimicrobiales bacterium]